MAPAKKKEPRAPAKELGPGISAQGRSKTYKRRGLWAIKKKNGGKFPVHEKQAKAAEPEGKVGAHVSNIKDAAVSVMAVRLNFKISVLSSDQQESLDLCSVEDLQ